MSTSAKKNGEALPDDNDEFFRNFKSLEGPIREHLMKVYTCLWMSNLAAALGACFHLFTDILSQNLLPFLIGVAFMMTLSKTPDESGKNVKTRIGLLFGFFFFTGLGLWPLLLRAFININAETIVLVLLFTTLVFIGPFYICTLMSPLDQYLLLSGPLLSLPLAFAYFLLAEYFSGSMTVDLQFNLYLGHPVVCGLLLYNTHRIIEKRQLGDKDYVSHSTDLFFIFFVDIYHFLVSITVKKKKDDKDRMKRRD